MVKKKKRSKNTKRTKRTSGKSSRKKSKSKTAKKSSPDARVIWLYGAHGSIVRNTARRLFDFGSDESNNLRNQLNLSMDEMVVPVHPYPAGSRTKVIKQLYDIEGATILVLGLHTDRNDDSLHKLYDGCEAVWVHPHEKQFHIDMMRETTEISFPDAENKMDKWLEFLEEHFNDNVSVIR